MSPEDRADEFDAFYSARAAKLVRSIYLKTGDLGRAQDCVQEAFVRAWMDWARVQKRNPAAWVRTVAWNLAISDWRAATRERAKQQKAAGNPSYDPPAHESIITVRSALRELSDDQQAVTVLHYFEDMAVRDIGQLMGKPDGTVKSLLHRARQALKPLLEAAEDGASPVAGEHSQGEVR